MTQLKLDQTRGKIWRAFSPDTTEAEAKAAFRARFGRDPETVGSALGVVLAGPVPEEATR